MTGHENGSQVAAGITDAEAEAVRRLVASLEAMDDDGLAGVREGIRRAVFVLSVQGQFSPDTAGVLELVGLYRALDDVVAAVRGRVTAEGAQRHG